MSEKDHVAYIAKLGMAEKLITDAKNFGADHVIHNLRLYHKARELDRYIYDLHFNPFYQDVPLKAADMRAYNELMERAEQALKEEDGDERT